MTWTYEVTNKYRDPNNFNIVAEITYTQTDTKGNVIFRGRDYFGSVTLTDADVAEQARKRIRNVFEPGDAALETITLGPIILPPDPVVDPNQQAIVDANLAFQKAFKDAQVAQLAQFNPDLQAVYDTLTTAQAVSGVAIKL